MYKHLLSVVILICLAAGACRKENKEEQNPEYEVMEIHRQTSDQPEYYSASIRGSQDVDIFPQVSGTITRVYVKEGQHVKRGEILFTIDQVSYQAALRTAKANLKSAGAKVEKAKLDVESKGALFRENVVSEYELKSAKNDLLLALAELEQMTAQELDARNSLSYTEVRSPVNGVVGNLPYRVGSLVNPSMEQPLTTVSDNAVMYAYFSINQNRWRELLRVYGSSEKAIDNLPELELMLNDGSVFNRRGKVMSVSGIINQQTGTVSVISAFPNPAGELLSGSIGNIIFPNSEKNVIVIPQRAANELQDKLFVFKVVNRDNSYFAKAVEIKADKMTDGKNFVVRSGLEEGDLIVSNGVGSLRDGMEINLAEKKKVSR